MNHFRSKFSFLLPVALAVLSQPTGVLAQHSDVEFEYSGGQIEIEFGSEGQVFEGEFPDSGADTQFTSEPGFGSELSEEAGINSLDEVVYNVLDSLLFWDGSSISPAAAGTQIRVENRGIGVPDTFISATSGPQPGSFLTPFNNRIGAADGNGDFHSDLDWFLEPNPGSPATGAYAVKLSLSTDEPGIANSDPFFIVFNFGLSETLFEEGVEAFAATIPEPTSLALIGAGVVALSLTRRRSGMLAPHLS